MLWPGLGRARLGLLGLVSVTVTDTVSIRQRDPSILRRFPKGPFSKYHFHVNDLFDSDDEEDPLHVRVVTTNKGSSGC
jgi:hypothetical protein